VESLTASTLALPVAPASPEETPATVILSPAAMAPPTPEPADSHQTEPTVLMPALRVPPVAVPPPLPRPAAVPAPPPLPNTATLGARPAAVEPTPTATLTLRPAAVEPPPTATVTVRPTAVEPLPTAPMPAAPLPASIEAPPSVPASPPALSAPARPPAPRPGLPLPVVILGGASAGLVVVGIGAWLLRPAPVADPGPAVAPPVTQTAVQPTPEPATPHETPAVAATEAPRPRPTPSPRRSAPASGAADFVSSPPGATVTVDGKAVGTTPLRGLKLAPGKRQVEIALDGHEPWGTTLDVTAGTTGSVDVRLRARPVPTPTPEPVDTARVYPNEAGQVDTLARRLSGSSPSYPSGRAPRLRSGQRVSVLLRLVVDENGAVRDVTVVESAGKVVDDVVVSAVKSWKYEPATKGGVRVKVEATFRQTFLGA
jgi:TonB family protein